MSHAVPITHVRPADVLAVLRSVTSPRSAQRHARRLDAVKIGGLLAVPIAKIRRDLGDDIADAVLAAAERRINQRGTAVLDVGEGTR